MIEANVWCCDMLFLLWCSGANLSQGDVNDECHRQYQHHCFQVDISHHSFNVLVGVLLCSPKGMDLCLELFHVEHYVSCIVVNVLICEVVPSLSVPRGTLDFIFD